MGIRTNGLYTRPVCGDGIDYVVKTLREGGGMN